MRTYLCLVLISLATAASADDRPNFRPATEAQIRQHLRGASSLGNTREGFAYNADTGLGYKISKGSVCVRYPTGEVDCVKMLYNGSRLQMIDGRGNREWIN